MVLVCRTAFSIDHCLTSNLFQNTLLLKVSSQIRSLQALTLQNFSSTRWVVVKVLLTLRSRQLKLDTCSVDL